MSTVPVRDDDYCCRPEHVLRPGNTNCAGCGMSLGLQLLEKGLGDRPLTFCIPACCGIVTAGAFPTSAYGVPVVATTFASAAAVASGVRAIQRINGDPGETVCWAGDGGTYDIGVATLSAAAERNEDIIYFCYDNEIYGNTGGQRSSATPPGAVTSTTPKGKLEVKKNMMRILAAHRIPYAATLSLAHKDDFVRKLELGKTIRGFRFFLIHSPCPTGWKSDPAESVELVRLAVDSGIFPLYEVFGGRRFRINAEPRGTPVEAYLERQGRFRKGTVDADALRADIERDWDELRRLAAAFPADPA
jgi:pyruvate ferredoxin oxidoreductase beta subunit/2-oxoisovalerate ferredoxin oxidoreductase beta subunit